MASNHLVQAARALNGVERARLMEALASQRDRTAADGGTPLSVFYAAMYQAALMALADVTREREREDTEASRIARRNGFG